MGLWANDTCCYSQLQSRPFRLYSASILDSPSLQVQLDNSKNKLLLLLLFLLLLLLLIATGLHTC